MTTLSRKSYLPDVHRLLPQSTDAEKCLLACLMCAPEESIEACGEAGVTEEWFCIPAHAEIWSVIEPMHAAGKPIDLRSVTQTLHDLGKLDYAGGPANITEIANVMPFGTNVRYYVEVCREKWFLRGVIRDTTALASKAYEGNSSQDDAKGIISDFELLLMKYTSESVTSRRRKSAKELVYDVVDSLSDPELVYGISTGFKSLDSVAGGLQAGAKIVLAGGTSSGKSSLAHNIAVSLAGKRKIPTAILTFEMSDQQYMQRMIATYSGVSVKKIVRKTADQSEVALFMRAAQDLAESPLFIIGEALNFAGIRARLLQLKKYGLRVAIIDYLQIVPERRQRGESESDKLDRVSRANKQMARDLGITLIELSQLTKRDDGTLVTRGSGGITMDADELWIVSGEEDEKEIEIAKQRDGKKSTVEFRFDGEITRFREKAY